MRLSDFKNHLGTVNTIDFKLPSGEHVPAHFHVTEVGLIKKNFIDCGGRMRKENKINFQLFTATDYDHRLAAHKLKAIIDLSEKQLELPDAEIEVEYQGETIGKYGLDFENGSFLLTTKQTDCLAKDSCGIEEQQKSITNASCAPGSGCC